MMPHPSHPQQPIGVFDSGVGGLSVWNALHDLLPEEAIAYLADQQHVPYGSRSRSEIEALTHAAAEWLWQQGAKLLVIACNTASAVALNSLRQRWPQAAIVGMEPAVKPASAATRSGRVGVLATPETLHAERFQRLVAHFAAGVEVHTQICPYLVEWVEAGQLDGPQIEAYLTDVLAHLKQKQVDQLVLGCTHYPFLSPVIQRVMGPAVTLVDPAAAVARQVQRLLRSCQLLGHQSSPDYVFYTTAAAPRLSRQVSQLTPIIHPRVHQAELVQLTPGKTL
ncbi:MAG: glutamate racemase [Chloroflexi bacterium]|nr:glutamate racemase [Chloroflexota bacterium]